jgi:hypothetical protein
MSPLRGLGNNIRIYSYNHATPSGLKTLELHHLIYPYPDNHVTHSGLKT